MRRIVGLVLAGLGACLVVFAVLMPTYVSSRVIKFPLNQFATANLVDNNASYFSPVKLTELTGVTMQATYTLKGNANAGSSSAAVWNQFIYVYDETNKQPFQTMTRTMTFDRHTAQLTNCCGSNVNGDSSVQQRGVVGYVFPIGTQKQTYQVFDANLLKPVPFTFAGTDTVDGIAAYRFVEDVSPTQNGRQTLPGSLVGQSQASVTLPQFYQTHVTYWIDPDTGVLLKAIQNEKVFLEDSSGAQALLLFNANLVMTPASVKGLVALDNDQRNNKSTVETILPLATGIGGAVLLVAGILFARKPREDVEAAHPAPVSAPEAPQVPAVPEPTAVGESAQSAERPSLVPGLDDESHEATAESPVVEPSAPSAAGASAAEAEAEPAGTQAAETGEQPGEPEAPTAELPAEQQDAAQTAEAPATAATVPQPAAEEEEEPNHATGRHRR